MVILFLLWHPCSVFSIFYITAFKCNLTNNDYYNNNNNNDKYYTTAAVTTTTTKTTTNITLYSKWNWKHKHCQNKMINEERTGSQFNILRGLNYQCLAGTWPWETQGNVWSGSPCYQAFCSVSAGHCWNKRPHSAPRLRKMADLMFSESFDSTRTGCLKENWQSFARSLLFLPISVDFQ